MFHVPIEYFWSAIVLGTVSFALGYILGGDHSDDE